MIWLLHAVCRWRRVLSEYVHPSLWIILDDIGPRWARIRTVVLTGSIIVLDASCRKLLSTHGVLQAICWRDTKLIFLGYVCHR